MSFIDTVPSTGLKVASRSPFPEIRQWSCALPLAQEFLGSFCLLDPSLHTLCVTGVAIIWLCVLSPSSTATWKTSPWGFRSSLGLPMSGSLNPTPSTRCTGSREKLSPPPAMRRSWATPKSWRSRWSQKTTWGRRKGWGWGLWAVGRYGAKLQGLGEGTPWGWWEQPQMVVPSLWWTHNDYCSKVSILKVLYLDIIHGCYLCIFRVCWWGWD